MEARYRETSPPAFLAGVADAVWEARFEEPVPEWLVLPDGCVDLVLVPGAPPLVAGPATRDAASAYGGGTCAVGLRVRPGALAGLLPARAHELRDRLVPLADVTGRAGPPGMQRAWEAVQAGDPGRARVLLAAALGETAAPERVDALVARAAGLLREDPGLGVAAVARIVACSPRQLRRRFEEHVGYGPKRFARIMRLQAFLREEARNPDASLARLAADSGYADHPHLSRECAELAGRTPSALVAHRVASRAVAARDGRSDQDAG